jgi:phospholipid transport system substrate-binding protein
MARFNRCLRCWAIGLILALSYPSAALAATPLQVIKDTIDRLVAIVQAPLSPDGSRADYRRTLLRRALHLRFDFSEMAKMSMGNHWHYVTPKQLEFVDVFTDLLERAYLQKIESLKDTKVVYVRERVDGDVAQVDTKIVPPIGEDIPVNYRLHLVGGEWKVYDILIRNVSVVENYRAQFHRILKFATIETLLHKLHEKLAEREG